MPDDINMPFIGPQAPGATPVQVDECPDVQQPIPPEEHRPLPCVTPTPTFMQESMDCLADVQMYNSQLAQPDLTDDSFEYSWGSRDIVCPPSFLSSLREPLHPGWKCLENPGKGGCLFMTGADHIGLKDYRILRKYVNMHMIEQWYFYCSFYVFPFNITVDAGNVSYCKTIKMKWIFTPSCNQKNPCYLTMIHKQKLLHLEMC